MKSPYQRLARLSAQLFDPCAAMLLCTYANIYRNIACFLSIVRAEVAAATGA
jgi:hypothetical protein